MTSEIPINISNKAIEEAIKIYKTKNIPKEYGLRIGVKGSTGCAGANFIIGFDTLNKDDDAIFTFNSLKIFINKKHFLFLAGQSVDYVSNNEEQGFVFNKS